jgi:hypothetical protein
MPIGKSKTFVWRCDVGCSKGRPAIAESSIALALRSGAGGADVIGILVFIGFAGWSASASWPSTPHAIGSRYSLSRAPYRPHPDARRRATAQRARAADRRSISGRLLRSAGDHRLPAAGARGRGVTVRGPTPSSGAARRRAGRRHDSTAQRLWLVRTDAAR